MTFPCQGPIKIGRDERTPFGSAKIGCGFSLFLVESFRVALSLKNYRPGILGHHILV